MSGRWVMPPASRALPAVTAVMLAAVGVALIAQRDAEVLGPLHPVGAAALGLFYLLVAAGQAWLAGRPR